MPLINDALDESAEMPAGILLSPIRIT